MERSDFDYISETLDKLYQMFEESFSFTFSEEEIAKFKKKIEYLDSKLDMQQELSNLLCEIHNEIIDLQNFLNNHRPLIEEEEKPEQVPGIEHLEITIPSSDSASADSAESKGREKLPFTFLRSISNSAYTRYYTAYKEAKSIVRKLREENPGEFIWDLTFHKITTSVPDAKTLYANLKEVDDEFDTIELTKKFGKEFVRFHKVFKNMLRIAETYASRKQK